MKNIKLMADYQCHPIWNMSPTEYGDINPDELPISDGLKSRLAGWAHAYDLTLDMEDPASSGFKSEEDEIEFKREANRLVEQLRAELGSEFHVTVKV